MEPRLYIQLQCECNFMERTSLCQIYLCILGRVSENKKTQRVPLTPRWSQEMSSENQHKQRKRKIRSHIHNISAVLSVKGQYILACTMSLTSFFPLVPQGGIQEGCRHSRMVRLWVLVPGSPLLLYNVTKSHSHTMPQFPDQ